MGFACLAAGLVKREVTFDETGAGNNTNMLLISIMGISIPTLMLSIGQFEVQDETDLSMSHFISVVLLVLYGFYLVFTMTEPKKEKVEKLLDAEKDEEEEDDEEEEEAVLTLGAAVFWLLLGTPCAAAPTQTGGGERRSCGSRVLARSFSRRSHRHPRLPLRAARRRRRGGLRRPPHPQGLRRLRDQYPDLRLEP